MSKVSFYFFGIIIMSFAFSCQKKTTQNNVELATEKEGSFGYDVNFLKKHQSTILLTASDDANAQALIIAGYQGRVMTSTTDGNAGNSYGWINYNLI